MSSDNQPSADGQEERPTADSRLHVGSEQPVSPEDLVEASGRDLTPENLAWARRKLETEGREAIDRLLP
ncbi:hypothetical protein [Phaeacidiphilus oryzae]|uniref:hypothetical protein n=1 Tax=Phaeacidiphilus oryzae TaxID=348818 RepID=UPI00055CD48D|nr:hypothetical protein [Phaeacidiphilus oryzae]